MAQAVVNTAVMQCTCGSAPATLTVTSQAQTMIGNQLAATIMDFATGANIPPFGTCSVLTAAASGVPTPCAMVPTGPWIPGSTSIVRIGNFQALLSTDKLMCGIPGMISITYPGQVTTNDT